jgi:lysine 6-dehydrogenase
MRVAILGSGQQAQGALQYLSDKKVKITVVDQDIEQAKKLVDLYNNYHEYGDGDNLWTNEGEVLTWHGITAAGLDASNEGELTLFLQDYEAAFNALPYSLSLTATKAAIAAKCNLVDLGGNSKIVEQQLALSDQADRQGVTIIPDCGLAPGLVSLLTADAVEDPLFSRIDSVKIYVGGLPLEPKKAGPLEYTPVFSFAGLINEYVEPVRALRNGKLVELQPLTELENIHFSSSSRTWAELEAFTTSGGASTLPETFQGRVANLEYKTLRFPGHWKALQLLKSMDSFNVETFKKLCPPGLRDQIFVKVVADGYTPTEAKIKRTYLIHETGNNGSTRDSWREADPDAPEDPHHSISAMMKCTAYPAAIILMMLGNSDLRIPHGVHRQEHIINPRHVMKMLTKRGVRIEIKDDIEHDPRSF